VAEQKENFSVKRLLITILIVLVTAVAVGGSVWYMTGQSSLTNKNVSGIVKKTTDADDTTLYNNDEYNISFRYPSNMVLDTDISHSMVTDENGRSYYEETLKEKGVDEETGWNSLSVLITIEKTKSRNIKEYLQAGRIRNGDKEVKNVKLKSIRAVIDNNINGAWLAYYSLPGDRPQASLVKNGYVYTFYPKIADSDIYLNTAPTIGPSFISRDGLDGQENVISNLKKSAEQYASFFSLLESIEIK